MDNITKYQMNKINKLAYEIAVRKACDPTKMIDVNIPVKDKNGNETGRFKTVKKGKKVVWFKNNIVKGEFFVNRIVPSKFDNNVRRITLVPVDKELREYNKDGTHVVQWGNSYECLVTEPWRYFSVSSNDLEQATEIILKKEVR